MYNIIHSIMDAFLLNILRIYVLDNVRMPCMICVYYSNNILYAALIVMSTERIQFCKRSLKNTTPSSIYIDRI